MATRRTVLRTALFGAAAAAGLPAAAPAFAAPSKAGPGRLLLPAFPPPKRLDVADLNGLPGEDQLLLTTLQGIVNRSRPAVYLLNPGGDTDARWLSAIDVPKTTLDHPLDLIGRHRSAVRGAIVPDPDVPHSINVATTLAGLENAVVADADRAKAHGLPIVQDLRGRFDATGHDAVSVYRWQVQNLADRCTTRLVAGLPPTQSVAVTGVTWHQIAKETRQIRDSSNRGTYTLDLAPALGGDENAVYLRFQDSFTDDGWGASLGSLTVTADGKTVADFKPGTDAEKTVLFDAGGSSLGDEGNRFADGGSYFIYKLPVPAGTKTLTARAELWNQYLVTATDTAPTRTEPFPIFRDYVAATRAMVCWLPPAGDSGTLLASIFDRYPATTPYMGWFSNDVSGEWDGTDLASRHGLEVLAADFYANGTVHAGLPAAVESRPRPRPPAKKPRTTTYLTLTFGEGDNIQYCQRHMRELWDDAKRGAVPVNWTVSPVLAEAGPAILAHYQHTATDNDLLICGPSGAGYSYLGSWTEKDFPAYAELSGKFLRRTGMDLVYAYNNRDDSGWLPVPDRVGDVLAAHTPLRGIVLSWEKGGLYQSPGGIPLVGNLMPSGGAADYRTALLAHVAELRKKQPDGPLFVAGAVNAWNWTPTDVAQLAEALSGDDVEIVRGDAFFDLIRAAGTP